MLKREAINRNTETAPEDTRKAMRKTRILKLLIDVPSKMQTELWRGLSGLRGL